MELGRKTIRLTCCLTRQTEKQTNKFTFGRPVTHDSVSLEGGSDNFSSEKCAYTKCAYQLSLIGIPGQRIDFEPNTSCAGQTKSLAMQLWEEERRTERQAIADAGELTAVTQTCFAKS